MLRQSRNILYINNMYNRMCWEKVLEAMFSYVNSTVYSSYCASNYRQQTQCFSPARLQVVTPYCSCRQKIPANSIMQLLSPTQVTSWTLVIYLTLSKFNQSSIKQMSIISYTCRRQPYTMHGYLQLTVKHLLTVCTYSYNMATQNCNVSVYTL